jgi:hypothetical protein
MFIGGLLAFSGWISHMLWNLLAERHSALPEWSWMAGCGISAFMYIAVFSVWFARHKSNDKMANKNMPKSQSSAIMTTKTKKIKFNSKTTPPKKIISKKFIHLN